MSGIELLVLDDQWGQRDWAKEIEEALLGAGYTLKAFTTYAEAKAALETGWAPDFGLLDANLLPGERDMLGRVFMYDELRPRGIRCGHMSFDTRFGSDLFIYDKRRSVRELLTKLEEALRTIGKIAD